MDALKLPSINRSDPSAWLKKTSLLLLLLFVGWHGYLYMQLLKYRTVNPDTTAFMQHALSTMQEKHVDARLRQRWVNYNKISLQLKQAVIAAEDSSFTGHNGFDWQGIKIAMEKNINRGRITAGGSTISQQLAKNLFLSSEKSFWRKGEEAIIVIMMEAVLSKRRIFELYLNYAEWGKGIFGIEAAARHYYGIPASMLSSYQAATLASKLPNPRYYDGHHTRWLNEKSDMILSRMSKVNIPYE